MYTYCIFYYNKICSLIMTKIHFLGTYDARWRALILYVTRVFDLDLSTVDSFELNVVNCLSNFLPAQTE